MNFTIRQAMGLALLVACTAVTGLAAVVAVNQQHARLKTTDERYEELQGLHEIMSRTHAAQLLLTGDGEPAVVRRQLLEAVQAADRLINRLDATPPQSRSHFRATLENIRSSLESSLVADDDRSAADPVQQESPASIATLKACLAQIASLTDDATAAIAQDRVETIAHVQGARRMIAVLAAGTLLLALGLGWVQHRAVVPPLRMLRRGVEQMASGRRDAPIPEVGPREFRSLIAQFNHMSAQIHALEDSLNGQVEARNRQLIRSERLAGLGYLAAGLAHEINNPLGVIGGYAETMLRRLEDVKSDQADGQDDGSRSPMAATTMASELSDALRTITDEVFRCRDITTALLQMSRAGTSEEQHEPIDLHALVERVADMSRRLPAASQRNIIIDHAHAGPLITRGHRAQLTQVLVNLITNAFESVEPATGEVRITVASQSGSALIRIEDNGCGMNDDTLEHVFDPLFTDKPRRGLTGFGLGLSVSHGIIERHGGRIDAASEGPGRGSVFTIELPALATTSLLAEEACG